eukprot:2567651-Karenia_brevis.AAC.1
MHPHKRTAHHEGGPGPGPGPGDDLVPAPGPDSSPAFSAPSPAFLALGDTATVPWVVGRAPAAVPRD